MDYYAIRGVLAGLGVVVTAIALKSLLWDKLKAKFRQDAWVDKSKEVVANMELTVSALKDDMGEMRKRLRDLDHIAKSRSDDARKLDLLFKGVYAILTGDESLKQEAKSDFDEAMGFKR